MADRKAGEETREEEGGWKILESRETELQVTEQTNGERALPSAPSWCRRLGEAIRAAALAASCSRPPGHRKTAEPFFHKKKRPVSVAQALYHMLLLVEKAGQGLKKKRPES